MLWMSIKQLVVTSMITGTKFLGEPHLPMRWEMYVQLWKETGADDVSESVNNVRNCQIAVVLCAW
jgi:hypothetical protein